MRLLVGFFVIKDEAVYNILKIGVHIPKKSLLILLMHSLMTLKVCSFRLLFFIQCSNRFMDQMYVGTRAQSAVDSHNSSIGNVTKKYWAKMLQLHSNNQQIHSDVSNLFWHIFDDG